MKRNLLKLLVCISILSIFFLCGFKRVALEEVNVQIAPYYTEIDYMSVYNPGVEYPVLTYNSVTYIPLTQPLANRLGLALGYDIKKGLYITKYNEAIYGQMPEDKPFGGDGTHLYWTDYTAIVPEYPIYVNGDFYNSFDEEYPFLNYRGITYLPLTYNLAVLELGLEIEFGEGKFFLNRSGNTYCSVEKLTASNGDDIILKQRNEIIEYTDEFGNKNILPVTWWERYKFRIDLDTLEYLGTYHSLREFSDEYYPEIKRDGENENIYTVENEQTKARELYYKGEKIDTLNNEAIDYFGREYIFDDVTFIYVNVFTNQMPSPYTSHSEYIYVKTSDGIKKLSWDDRCNLARILPDGIGGYYLCSDSYSPFHSSRWSTEFASVCHYKSDGSFCELTIPDTNSITGYKVHSGRLYVKAMYFGQDKNVAGYMPISAVNSGYYAVEVKDDSSVKLYHYIDGKVFTTRNGGFYCLFSTGRVTRIVNLLTGNIIKVG